MAEEVDDRITEVDEQNGVTTIRRAENIPVYCKVVGVTKDNPDRTNRQKLIREYASRGMLAYLEHDTLNITDKYAVSVSIDTPLGRQQIGLLPRTVAHEVADDLDLGKPWYAVILKVTGG